MELQFLIAGGFVVLERVDTIHPRRQIQIEPVAPGLFGKGGKSVGTGGKVLSIAVGTRPDHVQHNVTLGCLGSFAFFNGHGTRTNLLLGFLRRSQFTVEVEGIVHAFVGTAKDAGIVPCDSGDNSFIHGNNSSKVGENCVVGGIEVLFLKR